MADRSVSVSELGLSCSICLELFVKPRSLPCLHSFCQDCLYRYIDRVMRNSSSPAKGFNCPCCCVFIERPHSDADLDTWITSFPANFTLVSILDSVTDSPQSIDVLNIYCGNCSRNESDNDAEMRCIDCNENLCRKCKNVHLTDNSLSSHRFLDLKPHVNNADDAETLRKTVHEDQPDLDKLNELTMCTKHPGLVLKFRCEDHEEYCCSECALERHRKCDKLIPTLDKVTTTTEEMKIGLNQLMQNVTTGCEELLEFDQSQLKVFEESSRRVMADVQQVSKIMHDNVDAFERRATEEIKYNEKTFTMAISDRSDGINELKEKVARSKALMGIAETHGDSLQRHFATLQMKECLEQAEEKVYKAFKGIRMKEMDLPGLHELPAEMFKLTTSTDVEVKDTCKEVPTYAGLRPFDKRTAVLLSEMCVDNYGNIDGCEWISEDVILVAERDKKRLSLIDIKTQTAIDRANFPTPAWQTTKIDQSTIAVSFPDERKVRLVQVKPTKLGEIKDIQVDGKCHGLVYSKSNKMLMVLLRDQGRIAQYTLDGGIGHPIPVDVDTQSDIRAAYCIAHNDQLGHVYISCHERHKVVAINMKGERVFVYKSGNNKGPWGVTSDRDNNVYVSWFGSSKVEQLDESGAYIREVLGAKDELILPLIMNLNEDMDSFILTVSQNGKNIKHYRYM